MNSEPRAVLGALSEYYHQLYLRYDVYRCGLGGGYDECKALAEMGVPMEFGLEDYYEIVEAIRTLQSILDEPSLRYRQAYMQNLLLLFNYKLEECPVPDAQGAIDAAELSLQLEQVHV